jgi:capsular exopolysaccharide synthesis family protein
MLIPLNAEIELTRRSLLENIRNIRKSLLRKELKLNEDIRMLDNRMQRIPTTERELLEIERRFRILEGLYTFLLQKRAELSICLAAAESNTRLVDPARLLPGPIRPVPEKAYSIALLLGLLLPVSLILLFEKLNDTIVDLHTLKRFTRIPIIGVVRHSTFDHPLVTIEKPRSPIAEDYRNIRTNLQFFDDQNTCQVIMVTSSVGTEGKTYTAMNLACILAASGMRVVIVGLDLRKPRIVADFGLSNDIGCSNYLSGSASLDEVIQPSGVLDSLSIIPSGPIPPNPSELIISENMKKMIEELKPRFDKIIIDTPPVGLVSDGLVLGSLAQLSLFIVRYRVTRKEHLKHIEELHNNGQLGKLAIVFNAVKSGTSAYGYGYGYGYEASYGEYFEETDQKPGLRSLLKGKNQK